MPILSKPIKYFVQISRKLTKLGLIRLNWRQKSLSEGGSRTLLIAALALFGAASSSSCESPSLVKKEPTPMPVSENIQTDFEKDLESFKTANFDYIFVLRRTDGGVFDSEDKAFVKANTAPETNRRILSDGDKALILGSHFKFTPENLEALKKRFKLEDFSKAETKEAKEKVNGNAKKPANANINQKR